jgi:outer membrane lipoprotein-sorting protein
MKCVFPFAVGALALFSAVASAGAPSAHDILDHSEAAARLRDVTANATLTTGDAGGETRVKVFTMWRRLESDGVHFATLTQFSLPAEIRNEGILFEEHPGDENDVQLYLPRYKKVRRVEAQSQSSSFMGSTLSYSDIATPHAGDYGQKLLRSEPCPADQAVSCFVLELTPKTDDIAEHTGYSRSVQWIRSDNFMSTQTELFDRTGRLWKRIVASDIREVDPAGHKFFTCSLRVDDLVSKRFTTLRFEQVKANTGLSEGLFTAQNLAREM